VESTKPVRDVLTAEQRDNIAKLKYRVIEPVKTEKVIKSFTAEITAYCKCSKCCTKSDGIGASGHKMQVGQVAASRSLKFGTRLKIAGKIYTVTDRLAKRYDSRVDIYCNSHEEALKLGIKTERVEVLE
jgi:3D (Asp-Asp-Asp) domain-containing protein